MNKDYINYQEAYPNIEKALKDGARLHAFLSGGGLRVVRIEKKKDTETKDEDDNLISYGEHSYRCLSNSLWCIWCVFKVR